MEIWAAEKGLVGFILINLGTLYRLPCSLCGDDRCHWVLEKYEGKNQYMCKCQHVNLEFADAGEIPNV